MSTVPTVLNIQRQVEIVTRIAYDSAHPKQNKTVCRVLPKDTIEQSMKMGGAILSVVGVVRAAFNVVADVFATLKKKLPSKFLKFKTIFPLPFWAIDSLMSIYTIYDSVVHGRKAYDKEDKGGVYDHSLNATSNILNIAGNSALIASSAYSIKKVAVAAGVAGSAAAGINLALFVIYTLSQALNLKRVYKALSSIKAILMEPKKSPIERYKDGLNSIKDQLFLSLEEETQIAQKAVDVEHQDLLIEKALKRKFDILARRVGQGLATKLQNSLGKRALLSRLDSDDESVKEEAFKEGAKLLEEYRITLNRQVTVRVLKVTAGIFGIAACCALLAHPAGPVVAASVLFGAFFLLQTCAWYVANKQKDEDVYKWIDFEVPTVKELMRSYLKQVSADVAPLVTDKLQIAYDKSKEIFKTIDFSSWSKMQLPIGHSPIKFIASAS